MRLTHRLGWWILSCSVMALLAGCGGGSGTNTQTAEQQIVASNGNFRSRVQAILQGAAQEMGVQIDTQNFAGTVFTNGSDSGMGVLINTNIAGVENLTIENLRNGADVMFCYLRMDNGYRNFFVVRVRNDNGRWVADVRNLAGDTATVDASLQENARENEDKPKLTFDWDDGPCIDIEWKWFKIKICLKVPDPMDLLPLRTTSGGWENQLNNVCEQFCTSVWRAVQSRSNDSSRGVIVITRDDVLAVCQLLTGTVNTPLESIVDRPLAACYIQTRNGDGLPTNIFRPGLVSPGSGSYAVSGVPQIGISIEPSNLTIKTKSSPRARLEEARVQLLVPIDDGLVRMEIPVTP
jgi:hypothetical protein